MGVRPKAQCMAVVTSQADIDTCLFAMNNLSEWLNMKATSDFGENAYVYPISQSGNFDLYFASHTDTPTTMD